MQQGRTWVHWLGGWGGLVATHLGDGRNGLGVAKQHVLRYELHGSEHEIGQLPENVADEAEVRRQSETSGIILAAASYIAAAVSGGVRQDVVSRMYRWVQLSDVRMKKTYSEEKKRRPTRTFRGPPSSGLTSDVMHRTPE